MTTLAEALGPQGPEGTAPSPLAVAFKPTVAATALLVALHRHGVRPAYVVTPSKPPADVASWLTAVGFPPASVMPLQKVLAERPVVAALERGVRVTLATVSRPPKGPWLPVNPLTEWGWDYARAVTEIQAAGLTLPAGGWPRPETPPPSQWQGAPRVQVASMGGGLDSFAMLVDRVAHGEVPELAIFADVTDPERKDPGEWQETYDHLREVVMPFCAQKGIEFEWLDTTRSPIRGHRSLMGYFAALRLMPSRQSRLCTAAAKVERITDELIRRYPNRPVEVWIGFEAGEDHRASKDPHATKAAGQADGWRRNRFPLIERNLCRCRCKLLLEAAGLPVPGKSACELCGFNTRGDWQLLEKKDPVAFAFAERMEDNCRPTKDGKTMRYGYEKGDGTDPRLRLWIAKPYKAMKIACTVCGAPVRASKKVGCAYVEGAA